MSQIYSMSSQYGELRPASGCDLLASLGHLSKFQRVSRLGSVTARHSSSGRQPNFAALNRGRHLYSAGRPSRWALAHILVWLLTLLKAINIDSNSRVSRKCNWKLQVRLKQHYRAVSEIWFSLHVSRRQHDAVVNKGQPVCWTALGPDHILRKRRKALCIAV